MYGQCTVVSTEMLKSRHGYAGIICVGGDGIVNEVLEHDPCASVVQFKNPLLHCWEVVSLCLQCLREQSMLSCILVLLPLWVGFANICLP